MVKKHKTSGKQAIQKTPVVSSPGQPGKHKKTYVRKRKKVGAGNGKKSPVNGRPTLQTPEIIDRVRNALRVGLDWKTAAMCAGISERTLRGWREDDPELSAALNEAKASAVVGVAAHLMKRIQGGDTAAIRFFLSTRTHEFKEGPSVAVQVNQQAVVGPPIPSDRDLGSFVQQFGEIAARLLPDSDTEGNGHA